MTDQADPSDPDIPPAPEPATSDPGKLIRIAAMTRAVLEEIRRSPLDHAACSEVFRIHRASLDELREVLSGEMQDEFDDIFAPFDGEPTEAVLRVASAQLIGWLEGLFHGIQATIATQQMMAASQLAQMHPRQIEAPKATDTGPTPGTYL